MKKQERDELRRRFREKLKTLLARRGMSLKQVAERTGLPYTWLRKLASEGSDGLKSDTKGTGTKNKLAQLAVFCGLRNRSDWWSDYMPKRDEAAK